MKRLLVLFAIGYTLLAIPSVAFAQTTPGTAHGSCGLDQIDTALGCLPTNQQQLINLLFKWSLGLAGVTAFLLILFGSFQYITAAGKPDQLQKAQETIVSALTGLVIIIFSVVILKIIGVEILQLPGL